MTKKIDLKKAAEASAKIASGITTEAVDATLEGAKGQFKAVVVIGLTESDNIDFATNVPQYPFIHWMMNRGTFELNLHEREEKMRKASVAPEAVDEG